MMKNRELCKKLKLLDPNWEVAIPIEGKLSAITGNFDVIVVSNPPFPFGNDYQTRIKIEDCPCLILLVYNDEE